MDKTAIFGRSFLATLCATAFGASAVFAAPLPVAPGPVLQATPVAADCYSIGEQVAASQGGTLARATASTQGGRPVCVVVVLVPGKEGQRPKRVEVTVPAG